MGSLGTCGVAKAYRNNWLFLPGVVAATRVEVMLGELKSTFNNQRDGFWALEVRFFLI